MPTSSFPLTTSLCHAQVLLYLVASRRSTTWMGTPPSKKWRCSWILTRSAPPSRFANNSSLDRYVGHCFYIFCCHHPLYHTTSAAALSEPFPSPSLSSLFPTSRLLFTQVYAVIVSHPLNGDLSPAAVSYTSGFYHIPVIGISSRDSAFSDKVRNRAGSDLWERRKDHVVIRSFAFQNYIMPHHLFPLRKTSTPKESSDWIIFSSNKMPAIFFLI